MRRDRGGRCRVQGGARDRARYALRGRSRGQGVLHADWDARCDRSRGDRGAGSGGYEDRGARGDRATCARASRAAVPVAGAAIAVVRRMRAILVGLTVFAACGGGNAGTSDAALVADGRAADAFVPQDAPFCPAIAALDPAQLSELTIAGDTPALGIFDPSIVYLGDATGGVMAYSAVPTQQTIRTHIAGSTDHGATWTFAVEANAPEAATEPSPACGTTTCSGNLISEVSSLIYDADDPETTKRWKLFAHRYLVGPNVELHYDIGTITLQTAAQPQGPWTAPQKLIGW